MKSKGNGFSTLNAKDDVARKANIIAATEGMHVYEVIEDALKSRFPDYFNSVEA